MSKKERVSDAKARLAAIIAARKGTNNACRQTDSKANNPRAASTESKSIGHPVQSTDTEESPRVTAPKVSSRGDATPTSIPPISEVQITPNTPLTQKLTELRDALEAQLPELPYILKTIHTTLAQSPDVVPVLSDDEIGLFVQGLIQHTNTTIVPAPKKGTSKKSQPISLDMLV